MSAGKGGKGGKSGKDSDLLKLYHYTNSDGIRGIATSGQIGESTDTKKDAAFGRGAYATTQGPHNSKADIAKNNYDGRRNQWSKMESQGKVDHCVEFTVPRSNVDRAPIKDRDVYVHQGPVDLKKDAKDVKFHVRQSDGKFKTYEHN